MTNNKKKRGKRGSSEESPTVKKKPNTQSSASEAGEANMVDDQARTIHGKVFVKTSPNGSPTKINDEADFNYL